MLNLSSLYLLLSLSLAVSTIILCVMLMSMHIPDKEQIKQYNVARYALAFAYLITGVFNGFKIITSLAHNIDMGLINTLTLVSASYQALLFTFVLLTLIQPFYVSVRRVVIQFGLITFFFITLLALLYNVPRPLYQHFYNIFSVVYISQLIYYIALFRKKYAHYIKQLDDYYNEDENNRLEWVKTSFNMALIIGIIALGISHIPLYYCIYYIIPINIFYIYFAVKYINYPLDFQYIIPAVYVDETVTVTDPEPDVNAVEDLPLLSEKEKKLQEAIDKWVKEKRFLYAYISRDDIAKSLGTDRDFLALFFHNHMKMEFRVWRTQLRIEEAKNLLLEYPDLSISKIANNVGICDRSNFQKKFIDSIGISPKDWRAQNLKE